MNISEQIAANLAAAKLDMEQAEEIYAEALGRAQAVRDRIAAFEARRAEITAHRLAGEAVEAETAEFAALAGDIEALQGLLTESEAAAASLEPIEARNMLAAAESEWQRHLSQNSIQALREQTCKLEALFCKNLSALAHEAQQAGYQNLNQVWTPSDGLKNAVTRTNLDVFTFKRAA